MVLIFDEAHIAILAEYFNYSNIFSAKYVVELLEHTRINDYAIKLEEGKQLLFGLIYSLKLVELETLKTYIKANLANGFSWPFMSPAKVPIFFD